MKCKEHGATAFTPLLVEHQTVNIPFIRLVGFYIKGDSVPSHWRLRKDEFYNYITLF